MASSPYEECRDKPYDYQQDEGLVFPGPAIEMAQAAEVDPYDYSRVLDQLAPTAEAAFCAIHDVVYVHSKTINRIYRDYLRDEILRPTDTARFVLMLHSLYEQRAEDCSQDEFVEAITEKYQVSLSPKLGTTLQEHAEKLEKFETESEKVVESVESIVNGDDADAYRVAKLLSKPPINVTSPSHVIVQHYSVVATEFGAPNVYYDLEQRIKEGDLDHHIARDILLTNLRKAAEGGELKGVDREINNMIKLVERALPSNMDVIQFLSQPESSADWGTGSRHLLDEMRETLANDLRQRFLRRREWAFAEGMIYPTATEQDLAKYFNAHPEYFKTHGHKGVSKADYVERRVKRRKRGGGQRAVGGLAISQATPEKEKRIDRTIMCVMPNGDLFPEDSAQFRKMVEEYYDPEVAMGVIEYFRTAPRSKKIGRIDGLSSMHKAAHRVRDENGDLKRYPVVRLRTGQCVNLPVTAPSDMRTYVLTEGDDKVYIMAITDKSRAKGVRKRFNISELK